MLERNLCLPTHSIARWDLMLRDLVFLRQRQVLYNLISYVISQPFLHICLGITLVRKKLPTTLFVWDNLLHFSRYDFLVARVGSLSLLTDAFANFIIQKFLDLNITLYSHTPKRLYRTWEHLKNYDVHFA